ncbi:MAG: SsrA-binding protein SmpB [[Eubacterium] brachy]|jgi:ssrA-binding protein|nr:SsrA-binding protein [Eubacterium brachy ATCC 33089]MBF1134804.1 SsrA-binding protein SmpB [[Eubacterium] brachy]
MREKKIVANNKKARFDFFIEDIFEAGIVLTGTEIKSIRQGKVSINESYAKVRDGEIFILGMNISPYEQGNIFNVDPLRERKLLLSKREIRKIDEINRLKGKTIIPLRVYINERGLAKVQIGIGTGKKNYDKRDSIAKKDAERKMKIAAKRR